MPDEPTLSDRWTALFSAAQVEAEENEDCPPGAAEFFSRTAEYGGPEKAEGLLAELVTATDDALIWIYAGLREMEKGLEPGDGEERREGSREILEAVRALRRRAAFELDE